MLEYKVIRKVKSIYEKITNVLLFHKDSEILKLIFNNIDYYKKTSQIVYSEFKDYYEELIRLINNNEHLESLNLIFKSIPTTEDIRESIIYIRNELLKNCEKSIKLQKG